MTLKATDAPDRSPESGVGWGALLVGFSDVEDVVDWLYSVILLSIIENGALLGLCLRYNRGYKLWGGGV